MAEKVKFQPQKFDINSINGGNRYGLEGIQPEAVNAPIEAAAYAQALATNQPIYEENGGEPAIYIDETSGTPTLRFENLKGKDGQGANIDTELSDVSENPVQNKVITEALDNKVDKITVSASGKREVYGITADGEQITYPLEAEPSDNGVSGRVPLYTTYGGIRVARTIGANDVTKKDYVDNEIEAKGTSDYIAWTEGAKQEIIIASNNMQYYKNGAFLGHGGSHNYIEIAPNDVIDIYLDMSKGTNLYFNANGTELDFEATHMKVVVFGWNTIEGVQIMTNGRKV